jgi:Flp pilus assembly pilin Flp
MTFIKFLKIRNKSEETKGQSIVEYALLVGVAIITLLVAAFLYQTFQRSGNAFENFFDTVRRYIGGY